MLPKGFDVRNWGQMPNVSFLCFSVTTGQAANGPETAGLQRAQLAHASRQLTHSISDGNRRDLLRLTE